MFELVEASSLSSLLVGARERARVGYKAYYEELMPSMSVCKGGYVQQKENSFSRRRMRSAEVKITSRRRMILIKWKAIVE